MILQLISFDSYTSGRINSCFSTTYSPFWPWSPTWVQSQDSSSTWTRPKHQMKVLWAEWSAQPPQFILNSQTFWNSTISSSNSKYADSRRPNSYDLALFFQWKDRNLSFHSDICFEMEFRFGNYDFEKIWDLQAVVQYPSTKHYHSTSLPYFQ